MDLTLRRHQFLPTGIFGTLISSDDFLVHTLEHAYSIDAKFTPKLPVGVYTCVRGQHQLEGMKEPFETFEVTNVPGHTGVLFHVGNYNRDSSGCILVGLLKNDDGDGGGQMISGSRLAFAKFMQEQQLVESFQLTVCEDAV